MTGPSSDLLAAAALGAGLTPGALAPHLEGSDEPSEVLAAVGVSDGCAQIPPGRWFRLLSGESWTGPAQVTVAEDTAAVLLQREGSVVAMFGRTPARDQRSRELRLSVASGGADSRVTADGTTLELDPEALRVVGPARDVFVVADGVFIARARGEDLLFDLQAVLDRRALRQRDARAGQLREEYRAAVVRDATTGVRHRYEISPDPVPPDSAVEVIVRSDRPLDDVRLAWSSDGTEPPDPASNGLGDSLRPDADGSAWRGTIPEQPSGARVRYRIAYEDENGWHAVADAAPAHTTPDPHVLYMRPPRDGFSYAVDPPGPPGWAQDATFYHLLVDRWARHDGEPLTPAEHLEPMAFAGGTLLGACERLDHLERLGVDAVLLSPITPGEMHCAYDVKDLHGVDDRLGSVEDAQMFCRAAHDRGIRVVLDLELSYLGGRHPAALRALTDPASEERRWFHQSEDPPRLWGWMGANPMFRPVDHHHEPIRRQLLESALFWLDVGFDGFRLDSAHAAPLDFWAELGLMVRRHRSDAFTFGEVTAAHEERVKLRGRLDGYADFDVEHAIRAFVVGDGAGLASSLAGAAARAAHQPALAAVTFVESHDDSRVSLLVGGDERRVRLAHLLLLTLPGSPMLLYGTEVGLDQARPGNLDLELRRPMPWHDVDNERFAAVQRLVRLRRDHVALRRGAYETLVVDDDAAFVAYARVHEHETVVVAANGGARPLRRDVRLPGDESIEVSLNPAEAIVVGPDGLRLL